MEHIFKDASNLNVTLNERVKTVIAFLGVMFVMGSGIALKEMMRTFLSPVIQVKDVYTCTNVEIPQKPAFIWLIYVTDIMNVHMVMMRVIVS